MRPSLETLKGKKDLVGCEIGVNRGGNSREILGRLDVVKLYLVDPYEEKEVGLSGLKTAVQNLQPNSHRIVWIFKKSQDVTFEEIPEDSLDFVYIDGNHHYHFVKTDLEMYWPRVKTGGLFAGHDYCGTIMSKQVSRAVNEFFDEKGLGFETADMDWWIYK